MNVPTALLHPNLAIFEVNRIRFALKVKGLFFILCFSDSTWNSDVCNTQGIWRLKMQYYNIALCYANYFFPAAPATSASPTYQAGTKPLGKPAAARSLTSELKGPGAASALAPTHKAERWNRISDRSSAATGNMNRELKSDILLTARLPWFTSSLRSPPPPHASSQLLSTRKKRGSGKASRQTSEARSRFSFWHPPGQHYVITKDFLCMGVIFMAAWKCCGCII